MNRTTRRTFVCTASAGSVAALLATACGAGSESAPQATSAQPVTVTYMSNLPETHPEGEARLSLLDEFTKTNDGRITVSVDEGRASISLDKIKALAAGGTPPDLAYFAYYNTPEMFIAGATIDLETELKAEKDWGKQKADMFPAMLESSQWAGKLVGLPGYTNNQGMIYNIGLLTQHNVAAPKRGWTWDDFKTAASKITRPPDLWGANIAWSAWNVYLGTAGSRPLSKDSRKMQLETPEMQQVIEFFLDLIKNNIMPPDGKNNFYQQAQNDVAFENQGPYRIPTLRKNNAPAFGVVHAPVHPVKKEIHAPNGGHNMAVFREVPVERRHAAALVAKWMNAPHAQAIMCIRATSLPVSKSALESKELQEYLKTDPELKGFVDLAPNGYRWPPLPSYAQITKAANDGVAAIMRQEVGVKDGLAKAQRETQLLLDEDVRLMQ
ncbi:MAG: ABC transporter substrate-binding protein [Chloroflexota bacterium]